MPLRRDPGAPRPPAEHVYRGGRVLDVETGTVGPPVDIRTRDGVIEEIAASLPTGRDAVEVPLDGLTVLPGLIDSHVHVTQASGDFQEILSWPPSYHAARTEHVLHAMLRRGFTTVRDMGGADTGLPRAVEERLITGPQVKAGGPIFAPTGGHVLTQVCDGEVELRRAMRAQFRDGADHIKMTLSGGVISKMRIEALAFSDAEVEAAVDEARLAQRYIAAHVYTAEAVARALRLGVRTIEHGNLLDQECIELFLERNAYYVPTLATFWAILSGTTGHGLDAAKRAAVEEIFERGLESLAQASAAGVRIGYGTDLHGDGIPLQLEEFTLRARVQDPLAIIQSATTTGAEIIGETNRLGKIQEGYQADLIAVDGNPLENLDVLATGKALRYVITAGEPLTVN